MTCIIFCYISFFSLLILTNLKHQGLEEIFSDLKQWLFKITENTPNENLIQLRDQICAGFFLIFCPSLDSSLHYLEQVENLLEPEYFKALKIELENKETAKEKEIIEAKKEKENFIVSNTLTKKLSVLFLFLKEIAFNLLEKMKSRHGLLVAAIKSNTKNFFLFCKNLLQIILKKFKVL